MSDGRDCWFTIKVMALWIYLCREAIRLQRFGLRAHMNVTTFTHFAQNCSLGILDALHAWLYYACSFIPRWNSQFCSAAHRKGCFSVCNTAKLGKGSGDNAMNLPGDFQTVFFFFFLFSVSVSWNYTLSRKIKLIQAFIPSYITMNFMANLWNHASSPRHFTILELCMFIPHTHVHTRTHIHTHTLVSGKWLHRTWCEHDKGCGPTPINTCTCTSTHVTPIHIH